MRLKSNFQQGYLLIIAIILITIVSFIGSIVIYMCIDVTNSSTNILFSNKAFYIAASGLQIAKRDIIANGISCESINNTTKYTNAVFPPSATSPIGYFTVTGNINSALSALNQDIDASTTNIPLVSVTNFLSPSGAALIDNEIITYYGIQNTVLQKAKRGVAGTLATSHSVGSDVKQNMCILTSVGKAPTNINPIGERVLEEQLILLDSPPAVLAVQSLPEVFN